MSDQRRARVGRGRCRLSICLLLVGFSLFASGWARADDTIGLAASPVFNQINLNPGQHRQQVLTLTNTSDLPLAVGSEARGFAATDQFGGSAYPDEVGGPQRWFSLNPAEFLLAPHATRSIAITITVPPDARSGGAYTSLFFIATNPQPPPTAGSSVNLSARVGVFYFLTIGGDLHPAGHFDPITTHPVWNSTPLSFNLAFSNTGNIHVKPLTLVTVKNLWGRTSVQLTDPGEFVLPGKTRRWQVVLPRHFLLGPYSITFATVVAPGLAPLTQTVHFWVVPLPLFVGLWLGLGLAGWWGWRWWRRRQSGWR